MSGRVARPKRSRPAAGSHWWLLQLGAGGGLLACLLGLLVVGLAPLAGVQALGQIVYHENGFRHLALRLTPERLALLRAGLVGGTVGLALSGWWLRRQSPARPGLEAEWQRARTSARAGWQHQPVGARWAALGGLLALVVVRGWYLGYYPLGTDEVASYDYFVRHGLRAIIGFYPIPNNHIFYNLLAWPLAEAGFSPRLAMRLPSLLGGTLGTALGGLLLARLVGLRRATLVQGLVGLAPLWVYYASNGRGYFVQFGLLQLGLFAAVELLRPTSPYRRLSWLVFLSSSVLGLYTIPTYAYPLAALGLGLAGGFAGQHRWDRLRELVLAGSIIGLITLVLYLPTGTISGWDRLLSNRYVVARSPAQFWPQYRAFLYETAAEVFGPTLRLSGPAWLALAALGGVAARRWVVPGPRRTLALLAWVQLALPLLLMAAQRVYAPTRVLLYLTFFGYLLLVLLLARVPWPRRLPPWARWVVTLGLVAGVGGYRLWHDRAHVQASRHETQQFEQAFAWLQGHARPQGPAARVWLNAPLHELFFNHYLHQQSARPAVRLSSHRGTLPPPGTYDFLVLNTRRGSHLARPAAPYRAVYHDELVTIYTVR
jgi:hypothetical protein